MKSEEKSQLDHLKSEIEVLEKRVKDLEVYCSKYRLSEIAAEQIKSHLEELDKRFSDIRNEWKDMR